MEHADKLIIVNPSKSLPPRQFNSQASTRSLDLYKQTLRESGKESSQQEDTADELNEEERWWRGDSNQGEEHSRPDGRLGLARTSTRKAIVDGDLDRSFGNLQTAKARQSLNNILRDLNERDSMTDEELDREVIQIIS